MQYDMKLYNEPFEKIKNGNKTVEIRLNDEKRQLLKIGDKIRFTNIDSNEKLIVQVLNLYKFKDFKELYSYFDKTSMGYSLSDEVNPNHMLEYYSENNIKKYGALGIEIKLIENNLL